MVWQKVAKILANNLGIDEEDITPETELTGEHGIKAVELARLVIDCERKFKITIHDEDVHQFRYVRDLAAYIGRIQSDV